ncbi:MAG: phospholipid carrier-dependent glycosyltransferase [Verrucomicrobia bacterium]|nr:phospholipid carrier-dependent glycosyltransferase [Verrucomicrobiota bacterium]
MLTNPDLMAQMCTTNGGNANHSPDSQVANSASSCRKAAVILAALFLVLHLPGLPSLSHWRGDERFYTDAAVRMAISGDYLTPTYPDGSLRFKKPILPYWAVLAGFKLFGFNYFACRLAFLLSGALSIWLSYELCMALTRLPRESLVATAIMASNLTLHNTSIRSTPDALLCMFVLLSLLGFTKLFSGETRPVWYGLAYLGSAFAVTTKGMSGLLPVAYTFLFAGLSKNSANRIRNLLHPLFILLGLLIASAWYVWAFSKYGSAAAADFFGDQVGERFSGSKFYLIENAVVYLGSFIIQLLPWSAIALWAFVVKRHAVIRAMRANSRWLGFSVGWVLFLFLIFTCGNIQRTRYFLPAYPFLGLLYALPLLEGADDHKSAWVPAAAIKLAYAIACIGGIALGILGHQIALGLAIAGIILAACAGVLMLASTRLEPAMQITAAAAYVVLLFAVDLFLITPNFTFSTAPDITQRLLAEAKQQLVLPMAGMDVGEASQIRVLSAGKIQPYIVADNECDAAIKAHGQIVCTETVLKTWQPTGATVEHCATGSTRWKLRDYLALCRAADRHSFFVSKRVPYYLVTRSDAHRTQHRPDEPESGPNLQTAPADPPTTPGPSPR